jgi:hypothetical protein
MGGTTGLPRIPGRALGLTRSFNPGMGYTEPIATLWRDLETLYGREDEAGLGGSRTYRDTNRYVDSGVKTGRFRGFTRSVDMREQTVFEAVKKEPSLLNPAVSNRFTFARSKAILVNKLGSQQAAIGVMIQDPSILREGEDLESKSAGQIRTRAFAREFAPLVLVALAAGVAYQMSGVALPTNPFPNALPF